MFELEGIIHQLATKDEITINGERFKLKNIVKAADENILKVKYILESVTCIDPIEIDVGISAKIYRH